MSISTLLQKIQIGLILAADKREALTKILNLYIFFLLRTTKYRQTASNPQYIAIPIIQNPVFKLTLCIGLRRAPCRHAQPAHAAPNRKILNITWPIGKPCFFYSSVLLLQASHMMNPTTMMRMNASMYVLPMCMLVKKRAQDYTTVSEWSASAFPKNQLVHGKSGIMNPLQQYTNSMNVGYIIKAGAFNASTWGIRSPISADPGTEQVAFRIYFMMKRQVIT